MKITWYVDDGYVGKDRPHEVKIDAEDLYEDDMSDKEKQEAINDFIEEEFRNNISWYIGDISDD